MKTRSVRLHILLSMATMLMVAIAPPHVFAQGGINSGLFLSTVSQNFGEQSVGTQSNVYTTVLENDRRSDVSLTYSGADASYPMLSDNCGATLASGDTCQIQWAFSPQAAGYEELDYGISASINGSPVAITYYGESVSGVTLSGTGITGAVSLRTAGHNFGPWVEGTTSNEYLTILSNTTGEAVNLKYGYSANSDNAMFSETANTCGATLLSGASCSLEWAFSPTAEGAFGTTYDITAKDACGCTPITVTTGTQTVAGVTLTGHGSEGAGLSLASAGHDFGEQTVGGASVTYGTVLYNTTGTPVILSGHYDDVRAVNFKVVANDCGTTLAANTSCNAEWQFMPVTTGAISVVYDITATQGGSPVTLTSGGSPVNGVTLSGTGVQ